MIVDTSAIVAILRDEPEAVAFLEAIMAADIVRMSAGSWLELAVVTTRTADRRIGDTADALLDRLGVVIEDVTRDITAIARQAYRQYGRGTRHEADLNFGDCFAYALAKAMDEPLLFKGNDFAKTDIAAAR